MTRRVTAASSSSDKVGFCNGCDAYSIPVATMQSLLAWLNTQVTTGAVAVEPTEQVVGGSYKTPFCC